MLNASNVESAAEMSLPDTLPNDVVTRVNKDDSLRENETIEDLV